MPPFVPKRRLNETPPPSFTPPTKRVKLADPSESKPKQKTAPPIARPSDSSDDSDSSLSDVDSDQFEDVSAELTQSQKQEQEDGHSDDDVEWEDAAAPDQALHAPLPTENISININKEDDYIDYGASANKTAKKGPSRREKEVRLCTHQMHVQFLLYHNLLRNSWTCDKAVQKTLVDQLPSQIKKEVDKWKRASGLTEPENTSITPKSNKNGRRGKPKNERDERDWGRPSSRLEPRAADMSRGDPLISLLKVLSAYWKKRFAITAPGLRKRGYSTKLELRRDVDSYKRGTHDPELHGELVRNINDFRALARKCEGSRDVGAQLFTALLRGLGIESRLVASLQPSGYGWTKAEQMAPRKQPMNVQTKDTLSSSDDEDADQASTTKVTKKKKSVSSAKKTRPVGKGKGQKGTPINLDSDAEDVPDSDSVIDVTPSVPKARRPVYDRELAYPIYWTEAISPVTSRPIPCSPLVLEHPVATTDEFLAGFEPRGAKAEASKLVMAYVVGYSSDNSAKDLTVRYLRKHIFPGKAKPLRFPVRAIPVYSSSGKIKRYEDYDWFKTVLSPYARPDKMRTATDDLEDSTDLVPQEPEKKKEEEGVDTLTSLKSNPDFVLERHLRREEAIRPGTKPDRVFISGKEPSLKSEPVYRRSDVERCLTAESWHKEGRRPKHGEVSMKLVPVRAVTLTRKREAEEHERVTGKKQLQGLYSWDQTEYIIPPPIENGIIPKNGYGNIDAFVPSMVPRGAVHIPLRSTVRVCKKLEIDYAEAVVGFEFGNKRAVPVIQGVVVAKENEKMVRDAWKEYDEAQRKKEETKMERLVLDLWRKFVMGLRIQKEIGEVYGDRGEASNDFQAQAEKGQSKEEPIDVDVDDDMAGGFESETNEPTGNVEFGGGFLLPDEEDQREHDDLIMENFPATQEKCKEYVDINPQHDPAAEQDEAAAVPARSRKGKEKEDQYPTPVSLPPFKPKSATKGKRRTLLQQVDGSNGTDPRGDELSSLSDETPEDNPFSATPSSSLSDLSLSEASESESESEPGYLPASTTRRRRRATQAVVISPRQSQSQPIPTRTSARTTRFSPSKKKERQPTPNSKAQALSSSQKKPSAAVAVTPTTKRGRGRPRKAVVTSPYFDESDD